MPELADGCAAGERLTLEDPPGYVPSALALGSGGLTHPLLGAAAIKNDHTTVTACLDDVIGV